MVEERIVMSNGSVIDLYDVYQSVSGTLFQSNIHYDICSYIVKQTGTVGLLRKVLENLYSSKSQRIRLITAAVWFVEFRQCEISEIFVLDDIKYLLEYRGFCNKKLFDMGIYSGEYVDKKHIVTLVLKSFAHRIFHFFSNTLPPGSTVIRGWVDVTESMYFEQLKFARLRIFPFPLGFRRQLKFIGSCKKKCLDFDLDGLPYSISSAVKALFLGTGRDEAIASIEISANQKYANQLLKSRVTKVYTSDEFEVGAIAMYELLIASDVKVINTAHGVGRYCPYVAYTEFNGFTSSQGEFYRSKNSLIKVNVRKFQNSSLPLKRAEDARNLPLVFVLLHQNFEDYGLQSDASKLREIAKNISVLSKKLKIPFYIKLHPNVSSTNIGKLAAEFGAIPATSWLDISKFRTVFITINSTAFFDTMGFGPTLVLKADSFFPEVYYGKDFVGFRLDELEHKLTALIDSENWLYAVKNCAMKEGSFG
ncbi:MAG: hypothetical protein JXQ69_09340 [Paludibacteraceae bacterium]|nr:hypothetical protein [Paludibacteraceae bacterium]